MKVPKKPTTKHSLDWFSKENLQETMDVPMKYGGSLSKVSLRHL
jgi:hypothetical protein